MIEMKNNTLRKKLIRLAALLMLLALTINTAGCSGFPPKVSAENLMEQIKPNPVDGKTTDSQFINSTADFIVELFKKSVDDKKNSLVSPLSVMYALAMTANGAEGETLAQMEKVLGKEIPLDELNEYLHYYAENLPHVEKSKFKMANSIRFRDDENKLKVEKDFLQKNADYYNAEIYKSPFTDETILDINKWVKKNTDGMIEKIIDEIDEDTVMYLINAMVFDAEWKEVYSKGDIYQGQFTSWDGTKQTADFMRSEESYYLDDGRATGFIKPYFDDKYSFVALLPNEGIKIEDYIADLTGEGLLNTVSSAEPATVSASLPKFSYEYEITLNDVLKSMGMTDGFNPVTADFKRLGSSPIGNIYIGEVLHKTFISLDELGTKAGAVTKVEMKVESAILDLKIVTLNRPFVYAIIDNATMLPVFIGTVMSLTQ